MILLVHLLFGAAIGSAVKSIPLAIILAFLSHYFLDLIPHIEYPIENITKRQWRKAVPDILRVILDFCLGVFLILIFSKNYPIIYICAVLAILPDGFTILSYFATNKTLETHNESHKKIHFLEQIKISKFWRVTSQITAVAVSLVLLKI